MIKPISIALLVLLVIICMAEADPKKKWWQLIRWGPSPNKRRNLRRRRRPVIRRRRRPVIRRRRRPVVLRRRRRPVVVARRRHTGGWGNGGWGNGNGGYYPHGHGSYAPVHYHYHYPAGHGGYHVGNWGTDKNWETGAETGVWSGWGSYGACSKRCGRGIQRRSRSCTTGTRCVGAKTQTRVCNAQPCRGRWSGWGRYGACSKRCGRGIQRRSRSCVGGTKCVGAKTQSRVCNAHACPLRYRNLGCYKDTGRRAISGGHQNFPAHQAIRRCAEKARRLGNTYFAVQYNVECFTSRNAGHTYARYGRGGGCRYGRGGSWRMNVYRRYDEPQDDDVEDGDALDDNDYEYDTSDD